MTQQNTSNDITPAQAAEILCCTPIYVRYLIRQGRIPARRVSRIWLLNEADVRAFQRRPAGRPKKEQPQ